MVVDIDYLDDHDGHDGHGGLNDNDDHEEDGLEANDPGGCAGPAGHPLNSRQVFCIGESELNLIINLHVYLILKRHSPHTL